jgi:hypothetical protein
VAIKNNGTKRAHTGAGMSYAGWVRDSTTDQYGRTRVSAATKHICARTRAHVSLLRTRLETALCFHITVSTLPHTRHGGSLSILAEDTHDAELVY